jgi:hypothetical protein
LKMLGTSSTCHHIVHFLMLQNGYFRHIKSHFCRTGLQNHRTLLGHMNDDVKANIVDVVKDWI